MPHDASFSRETVAYLAALSKLGLSESEIEALARDLSSVLDYMKILDALPLEGVEPLAHPQGIDAPLDPDHPRPGIGADLALRESADTADGQFAVPRVVELTRKPGETDVPS